MHKSSRIQGTPAATRKETGLCQGKLYINIPLKALLRKAIYPLCRLPTTTWLPALGSLFKTLIKESLMSFNVLTREASTHVARLPTLAAASAVVL